MAKKRWKILRCAVIEKHKLHKTAEEMKVLQATDSTLQVVSDAVNAHELKGGVGFLFKDGLLYRR